MLTGKTFADVEKMLLGGGFLMNLRALWFFMIKLLRDIIADSSIFGLFNNKLIERSEKSILADH